MALLAQHVRPIRAGRAIAECFFPIPGVKDPGRRRKPDAAFVSAARWPLDRELPDSDPWPVVPNLAVEGVSPTNNWTDLDDKVTEYFAAGVELLWVVYPGADRVYAYSSPNSVRILNRTDVLDAVPVLPDFRLPLVEVFGTTAD
jgi:Uma2 family endonuclease